jgi:hypothetical protein
MNTYKTHQPSLEEFLVSLRNQAPPVILLEGSRKVEEAHQPLLTRMGALLAEALPNARFRSGNAEGSDSLFAAGVQSVDPKRMQVVTPYAGHRKKNIHPEYEVCSLSDVSAVHEHSLADSSIEATPTNGGLMGKRHTHPRLGAKAKYLLRDTLKVVGDPDHGLAPATAAILYTKADPMEGGTGHTLRVCQKYKVPFVLFTHWSYWVE